MNVIDLREQLELEAAWRLDELRHLRNLLGEAETEPAQAAAQRTLMVMTYAHFEGFVKQSLAIYGHAINEERITCGQANEVVAAAAFSPEFERLRSPEPLTTSAPSESRAAQRKLRQAERETEFVRSVRVMQDRRLALPLDKVVSTDSNLSSAVLRRNLYRLGLNPEEFAGYDGTVEFLLRSRNDIAHGKRTELVPERQVQKIASDVRELIREIIRLIYRAARWSWFRALPA